MNHGVSEHIVYFPRQWLVEMLTQCRALHGLLYMLRTHAGLNPRYTKLDGNKDMSVENLIRIEVNKAMIQDYEEFMRQWDKLGRMIYTFGNEDGDEFNKLYKRNDTRKYKMSNLKLKPKYGRRKETKEDR